MGEVKKGLALENDGEMSLEGAMIAIMLTVSCPEQSKRKKHERMYGCVHYKEVAHDDRRSLPWMRRARRRLSREL